MLEGKTPCVSDFESALEKLGYSSFRPGQHEAISTTMNGHNLLLVAPTGGGKSLCYQLPAVMLEGTTVVISPLVALMQDQCEALVARGVSATYLASTLGVKQMRERMYGLAAGAYKIAYVAPERLAYDGFRAILAKLNCPLFAIDEAHCISEWGHDFRPEYMAIGNVLSEVGAARILACTATATPIVRDEIINRLGLSADTKQLVQGFSRPNLALAVAEIRNKAERIRATDQCLEKALGSPGAARGTAIVYAGTRKRTEEEATRLEARGWRVEAYHAGISGRLREERLRGFAAGQLEIMVATNAFGMGIDRPDVRAVVHLSPPGSVEAYYQEVGRAGRDGLEATGLLLISPSDLPLRRHLLQMPVNGHQPDPEVVNHKWNLFLELMRWSEGGSCRHDAILRYFDDESETLAGCGRCDVCLDLMSTSDDKDETTLVVRKALSAVARVHGRFGLNVAAKLLAGENDRRLEACGLNSTKTFGALGEHTAEWIVRLLGRTVTAGWISFSGESRPVLLLTQEGEQVMTAKKPARIVLPPKHRKRLSKSPATGGRSQKQVRPLSEAQELDEGTRELFEKLRAHRLMVAINSGVPPYVVASDRSLRDIAALRPRNMAELELAHGIGPSKADRYGRGLLAIVAQVS